MRVKNVKAYVYVFQNQLSHLQNERYLSFTQAETAHLSSVMGRKGTLITTTSVQDRPQTQPYGQPLAKATQPPPLSSFAQDNDEDDTNVQMAFLTELLALPPSKAPLLQPSTENGNQLPAKAPHPSPPASPTQASNEDDKNVQKSFLDEFRALPSSRVPPSLPPTEYDDQPPAKTPQPPTPPSPAQDSNEGDTNVQKSFLAEFQALPSSKAPPSPPSTEEDGDTADVQNFLSKLLSLPPPTSTIPGVSCLLKEMLCF